MLDSKLTEERCPEHGYRYIAVETDSAEIYEVKCPLKHCYYGVERDDLTREEEDDAQAQG